MFVLITPSAKIEACANKELLGMNAWKRLLGSDMGNVSLTEV